MKIVMLCDLYVEQLRYQENLLAKYYVKHGHDVTVLASTFKNVDDFLTNHYDEKAPISRSFDRGAKIVRLPYSLNLFSRLRRFPNVLDFLKNENPDLIFVHNLHLNLREVARYKAQNPDCRVIMDFHADFSNSASSLASLLVLHRLFRKRFLEQFIWSIDDFFPVVPASADFLHEVYGVARDRMKLLPLGTDTDLARETKQSGARATVRRRLGIPEDALVIFTGGKLGPAKRTHLLLDALLELDNPSLHLLVVGDVGGGDAAYAARLSSRIAQYPRVHQAGWVTGDEVYSFMDACDLAVFPSSQSVLWQQSLSMGLPIIVGNYDGQDTSYLSRNGNVISLAPAEMEGGMLTSVLRSLLTNRPDLSARQEAALAVSSDLLSYDKVVALTLGHPVS